MSAEGPPFVRTDEEYLARQQERTKTPFRVQKLQQSVPPAKDGIYRTQRGAAWVDRSIATGEVVARSDDGPSVPPNLP